MGSRGGIGRRTRSRGVKAISKKERTPDAMESRRAVVTQMPLKHLLTATGRTAHVHGEKIAIMSAAFLAASPGRYSFFHRTEYRRSEYCLQSGGEGHFPSGSNIGKRFGRGPAVRNHQMPGYDDHRAASARVALHEQPWMLSGKVTDTSDGATKDLGVISRTIF